MTQKLVMIISIFIFSACHPLLTENTHQNMCPITANEVLSCIASSTHLSSKEISAKLDSLTSSSTSRSNTTKLNKLLCLSLHNRASKEQLQKGENILKENLKNNACKQQNLSGLLNIIQGDINLHNKFLDKNWNAYLKKKKLNKEEESDKLQIDNDIISYQRRIKDLEQQVRKLKEIESMLDKDLPQS